MIFCIFFVFPYFCFLSNLVVIYSGAAEVLVGEGDSVFLESPWELVVRSECDFSIKDSAHSRAAVVVEVGESASGYKDCSEDTLGDSVVVSDCCEFQEFGLVGYFHNFFKPCIGATGRSLLVPFEVEEVVEVFALL